MSLIQRLTKCWYGKESGEIVHRQEIAFFQILVRKTISHIQLNLKHMRTGCSSDDRVKGHKMLNEWHHLRLKALYHTISLYELIKKEQSQLYLAPSLML